MQPVVEVRRSGRERKPVSYVDVDDEDLDGRSRLSCSPQGLSVAPPWCWCA